MGLDDTKVTQKYAHVSKLDASNPGLLGATFKYQKSSQYNFKITS